MSNDHLGNMLTLAKSDGHTQSKGWDYHGNQQWWVDESGARIRDFRNLNQALREQIGEEHSWTDADGKTVTVPGRWLKYVLDELDQAIAILNVADGEALTQGFGVDGKIMQMRLVGPDGLLYQDVYVKQNAAGWLIELRDLGIGMAIGWDGRGNRRFTIGNAAPITYDADTGQTLVGKPERINIERWNTFDGGNLLKVFGGKLNPDTKVIEVAPEQGEDILYDSAGRRKEVHTINKDGDKEVQYVTHNDDGALATTTGPGNKHSKRGFDDAGRRNYYKDEKGWQKTHRKSGRVVGFQSESGGVTQETVYQKFFPGSDDVLQEQTTFQQGDGKTIDTHIHEQGTRADGGRETRIIGHRQVVMPGVKSSITCDSSFIVWGANMDTPRQTSDTSDADVKVITPHPDAGTILHTVKLPRSSGPDTTKRVSSVIRDPHNGNVEAIITNEKPDNDTGEAEPDDKTHIKFTGVSGTDRSAPAGLDRIFVKQKEDLTSVIQNVLSTTSMQAVVKLALANGMTPDDVAPGYMPLTIPADLFENNQNNFKTFKHLTEDLVGTLLPSHTMPTIEPKHKHHGFGFIQGLEIAVGVALAAMIPALAGHIAALDSGLLAAGGSAAAGWDAGIEAYAIAGAITSGAASIGNSMLEGKGIHWDMVGRQMVVGAMTAAAGYKLQAFGFGATKAASVDATKAAEAVQGISGVQVVAGEVLKGTAISLIQQTTAQMVGLIKHIDFEQVAVAAAASGGRAVAQSAMLSSASTKIQTAFTSKGQLPFEMIMMSNFAGAVSEGAMEHMLSGDRVYWDQKFYQSLASSAGELAGQYGNDKFTIQKQSEAHQAKTLTADAPQRAKASGTVLRVNERLKQQRVANKRQAHAQRQQASAGHDARQRQQGARAASHSSTTQNPFDSMPSAVAPIPTMGFYDEGGFGDFFTGVGHGYNQDWVGANQLFDAFGSDMHLMSPTALHAYTARYNATEALINQTGVAHTWSYKAGTFIGELAGIGPVIYALPATLVGGAVAGGVAGALSPTHSGSLSSHSFNTGIGVVTGAVGFKATEKMIAPVLNKAGQVIVSAGRAASDEASKALQALGMFGRNGRTLLPAKELGKLANSAASGGKYAGQYERFLSQTPEQLEKSMASFDKQITKHQNWLNKPSSKIKDWHKMPKQFRSNNLHHWRADAQRAQVYKELARRVLEIKNAELQATQRPFVN